MARPKKNNKIHVNRRHSSVEAVAAYDSLDLKVCFDIYGRILKSTPWLFYRTVGGDGLPFSQGWLSGWRFAQPSSLDLAHPPTIRKPASFPCRRSLTSCRRLSKMTIIWAVC
jgi:hypothetical protein